MEQADESQCSSSVTLLLSGFVGEEAPQAEKLSLDPGSGRVS